ncbi:facilitated trehalose transporter Tret1-like [Belonocnema kinseyi]|uniref:facilitated trehalose transporter Tret1-like n=1 Tax=Belonocnema kinseyi TaxID=2817044 RepID=UPI00143CD0F7|nr:facilitated trehalose transporter Tret1-like [Belonocnema kinseyi]
MKIRNWIFRTDSYDINKELKRSKRENDLNRVNDEGSRFLQYIAGICACVSMATWGSYGAWPSPAIPYLTSNSSAFLVTAKQGSLIISLYNLGDLLGGLINPLFIDRIGRKYTLLLFSLPGLIGWILIILANNYVYLYIARFIAGVGHGGTFNSLVMYLTEIAEKSIRGILVNMMHISLNAGVQVIILHGIELLACFGTHVMIERLNRRTLFLSTGLLASLCLGSVGIFFFMELYLEADVSSISFLPLVALVCFQIVYQFGIGTIPYIVQGELFPINVKGNAVACGMVMGSCFALGTTASYNALSNAAGIYTSFFFFATTALFGSVITFWIMPETKGRSLEEIQAMQNPKLKEKLDSERNNNKSLNL